MEFLFLQQWQAKKYIERKLKIGKKIKYPSIAQNSYGFSKNEKYINN